MRQRFCLRRGEVHNKSAVPSERKYCAQERTGRPTPVSQTIAVRAYFSNAVRISTGFDAKRGACGGVDENEILVLEVLR